TGFADGLPRSRVATAGSQSAHSPPERSNRDGAHISRNRGSPNGLRPYRPISSRCSQRGACRPCTSRRTLAFLQIIADAAQRAPVRVFNLDEAKATEASRPDERNFLAGAARSPAHSGNGHSGHSHAGHGHAGRCLGHGGTYSAIRALIFATRAQSFCAWASCAATAALLARSWSRAVCA